VGGVRNWLSRLVEMVLRRSRAKGSSVALDERYEIAAFFAQADDTLLLGAIGEAIEAVVTAAGLDALPPAAQVLARTNRAEYLVCNGGFRYFFEPEHHEAEATLAALQAIGAEQAVTALRCALSVFPGGRPHDDWRQRMDYLAAMSEEAHEQFEAGAHSIYELSPLQARFARVHQAELATLPPVVDHLPPQPLPATNARSRAVAIWFLSQGGRAEFAPLQPLTSRWSVRNGASFRPEWSTLAGVHLDDGCRDPIALIEELAGLRASRDVGRVVVEGERCDERGPGLLAALARLPQLRELQWTADTLSSELARGLPLLRGLQCVRIVVERVPLAEARLLANGWRPRRAELVSVKSPPAVRSLLAAAGWIVAP